MNDLELYIYIALVLIYFLTRVLRPRKAKKPPKNVTDASGPDRESSQTEPRQRPMTFEELLEEFTGYKEPPQTVNPADEVQEEEKKSEKPAPAIDDEFQYYEGYDDYKKGEYTNYDDVFEKTGDLKTLDEQVSLEEPLQKRMEVIEKKVYASSRAKKFREMLISRESFRDAVILKELLDPKYL
jgi:hypothetical protein